MDLLTILSTLEASDMERKTVSTKHNTDCISYQNLDEELEITVDNSDYSNIIQVCLANKNGTVYLYLNYNNRLHLKKWKLTDVTSFSIS